VTRGRGVKPDLDRERHAAHVGRCGNRVTSWCRDHDDHDHRPRAGSSGRRRVRGLPRRSRLPLERPDANPSDNSPSTTNPSQNVNDVPRHPCTMSRDITGRSGWDSVNTQVRAHAGSNAVSNRHDKGFWEHRDPGPRGYRPARHLSYPDLAGITPCIPARRRSRRFVPRGAAGGWLLRVVVGVIGEDLLPFVPVAESQGPGDVLVDGRLGEPGGVVQVDVGIDCNSFQARSQTVSSRPMPPQQGGRARPSTGHR